VSAEEEIIKRISLAAADITHPLLLPGIIAEIERKRHITAVENTIDDIEARIFQMEIRPDALDGVSRSDLEKLHKDRRSAWLNTGYTRNCLISWQTQLQNIASQAEELDRVILTPLHQSSYTEKTTDVIFANDLPTVAELDKSAESEQITSQDSSKKWSSEYGAGLEEYHATGYKIKSRVRVLMQEYDDKIRDCSLRIDGMAMATQWVRHSFPCAIVYSFINTVRTELATNATTYRLKGRRIWRLREIQAGILGICAPLL
jgi:hypothetical protein